MHSTLTSKSVQGTSLALECVHHVHGSDCLPLSMLGVCNGITDDVLEEDFEHSSGLLVDESRDTLDSTTTGQTPDGWLCNALDVVSQHLPVALSASLSEPFSTFSSSRHFFCALLRVESLWRWLSFITESCVKLHDPVGLLHWALSSLRIFKA